MKSLSLFFILILYSFLGLGQVADNSYRIFFSDKNNNGFSIDTPGDFLSQKAIERREKQGVIIKENDLPLTNAYIDSLKKLGCQILNKSKWFNSVVIYTTNSQLIDTITNLDFVKSKEKKKSYLKVSLHNESFGLQESSILSTHNTDIDYGNATTQISILNGHVLHQSNYLGQGMTIAVIDAGFYNTDILPAFDSLWNNNQIIGVKDFVDGDNSVFDAADHGMKVLSTMGGNIPGEIVGTAPKANYLLLRSENGISEYAIEEDNWVAAAEYADSIGVDVINTSLGYTVFDDASQNYTYANLDGNTTFITQAADVAASKGIVVVTSAGNQGNTPWKYISAPADGDSVLTIGAIDRYASYVNFSSTGPTSDGRIKPDVVAVGYQTTIQATDGSVTLGNGTSFSSPIIAGLAACLWQSLPELNNMEIVQRIKESAHQYSNPDNFLGYGVPDFGKAANLTGIKNGSNNDIIFKVYPNPFTDYLKIEFLLNKSSDALIELYNVTGKKALEKKNSLNGTNDIINLKGLINLPPGIYLLKISIGQSIIYKRISKL